MATDLTDNRLLSDELLQAFRERAPTVPMAGIASTGTSQRWGFTAKSRAGKTADEEKTT